MAKPNKHIDDLFKDGFENAELPLAGGEWEAIFSELHPTKKRKAWWIWLSLGALILAVVGSAVFFNSRQNQVLKNTEPKSVELQEENKTNFEDTINQKELTLDSTEKESLSDDGLKEKVNNEKESNLESKNTKSRPTDQLKLLAMESTKNLSNINPLKTNKTTALLMEKSEIIAKSSDNNLLKPEHSPISVPLITRDISSPNWPSQEDKSLLKKDFKLEISQPMYTPISPLSPSLQVGLIAGLAHNSQNINTQQQGQSLLKQYRDQNEQNTFTPSVNLVVRKRYKGFELQSGLGYSPRGQKINSLTFQLYDSIPFLNQNGDTLRFIPFNYRDTTLSDGFNSPSYRYVNVPFSIGKRIFISPKWHSTLRMNTSLNILTNASGNTTNAKGGLQTIDKEQLNRFVWNGGVGVSVGYKINSRYELEMGGEMVRDFTSMYKEATLNQKMTLSNIRLGIMYTLK